MGQDTSIRARLAGWALAIACGLLAQAAPAGGPATTRATTLSEHEGWLVELPAVDRAALIADLFTHRGRLRERRRLLSRRIADNALTVKKVVWAIIMPGGLVYAFNERRQVAADESALGSVRAALAECDRDLDRLDSVVAARAR
ncbi:MAG: hypothetical protein GWO02_00615 [Gammaproteobacteria bacterium]|nr:hypothetical protein [Gammaproteobacteria bacterium]